MKILSNIEIDQVSGAYASMSGNFSIGPNGFTFGNDFVMKVTGDSANILGNFKVYANKVVNGATVLYDGTQSSFCFNNYLFDIATIPGGHAYNCIGAC